jgi:hypothetical protein
MDMFTNSWERDRAAGDVRRDMRSYLPPRLARWGYRLITQNEGTMTFERRYAPVWTIVLAIILFPIGLLFPLLVKRTASLVFTVEGNGDSASNVTVNGQASEKLRRGLIGQYPPDAPPPAQT